MTDKTCELCDNPIEMKFMAVFTRAKGKAIVTGNICLACYGEYADDTAIALALLMKRQNQATPAQAPA